MKIEIDINKIVEEIDVNKLVEENIMSGIVDTIDFNNIVDEMFEDEEMKNNINKKVLDIISEYMSSDEGKEYITETFKDVLANSEILTDEKVVALIVAVLKKNLKLSS